MADFPYFFFLLDHFQSEDSDSFRRLKDEVDNKLALVDRAVEKNGEHVKKLRNLNKDILEQFKEIVEDHIKGQEQINGEIRDEIRSAIQIAMAEIERRYSGLEGLTKRDVDMLRVSEGKQSTS